MARPITGTEILLAHEIEERRARMKNLPTANDLFMGPYDNNPLVRRIIQLWKNGMMTFEQSLIMAVIELDNQNSQLQKILLENKMESTEPLILHTISRYL